MLIESTYQWYSDGYNYQAITGDAYGDPGALDTTTTYPGFQNAGEIVFWVQVADGGTSTSSSTYEFILRGSATTDGTDLNGTTVDLLTSPLFTQSGTWCQKTDPTNGFWFAVVPSIAQSYRYWQAYCNVVTEDTIDLSIFWGLAPKSAVPVRPNSQVPSETTVTCP